MQDRPGVNNTRDREGDKQPPDFLRPNREKQVPVRVEREPSFEQEAEQIEQKILQSIPGAQETKIGTQLTQQRTLTAPTPKDVLTTEIETILSEDLSPLYASLVPEQQKIFKSEGERTASAIRFLIEQIKLKTKSILALIRRWLQLIPGVNRFFLEQEAKIKTDKIMNLHDRIHHTNG